MKEFTSQTGGRYTYIDDIINLQDLSLAFASIFDDCDNFIISGCEVNGTAITSGYVYINGKIRYCAGSNSIDKWPVYIYEYNSIEQVAYADSGNKVGRNIYSCAIASAIPTTSDAITNNAPRYIVVSANGNAQRLKDAFFGKYALLLDTPYDYQTINKSVQFNGTIMVNSGMTVQNALNVIASNAKTNMYHSSDGTLVIDSQASPGTKCSIKLFTEGKFSFYVDDILVASIDNNILKVSQSIQAVQSTIGSLSIQNSHLYNSTMAEDSGSLYINYLSYQGDMNYYRTTIIGDGKGTALLSLDGAKKTCSLNTQMIIDAGKKAEALVIKGNGNIVWENGDDSKVARLIAGDVSLAIWWGGNHYALFHNPENSNYNTLYIPNGDISLGMGEVTLRTYMQRYNSLVTDVGQKANTADVYTSYYVDNNFVKCTYDGLKNFVDKVGGQSYACTLIGAAPLSNAVLQDQAFADIAKYGVNTANSDAVVARKKLLCKNIGAAYEGDIQQALKDTGWVTILNANGGVLMGRQVGHVVSIQGTLYAPHKGTAFTLPNNIDAPTYNIAYTPGYVSWSCQILGGQSDCVVTYCNKGCNKVINFLMTYLV